MMPTLASKIFRSKFFFNQKAFTLIEIMIVLAILAAAIGMGLPKIFKTTGTIQSAVRSLTVMSKEIRNRAKLHNTTYRLVIDMSEKDHHYWVESASRKVLLNKELMNKKELNEDEQKQLPRFSMDTFFGKKPRSLGDNLYFIQLETVNMNDSLSEGKGYIYFSPEGFVEAGALQIGNKKDLVWTLVFNPLTGQAEVFDSAKSLREMKE